MTDDPRRDSKPVLIVQCGREKQGAPAKQGAQGDEPVYPASELYTGSLWKTYASNSEPDTHHLYIISAKYGLIRGDDRIPHYNQEMTPQRAEEMRYKLCIQIGLEGLDQVAPERIFYAGGVGSKKKPSPYLTALRGAGLSFTPLTEVYKPPGTRGGVGANRSALSRFLQDINAGKPPKVKVSQAAKADRQVLTQQIAIENKRADLDFTEGLASVADWSHPQQRLDMGLQAGLGCRDLIHFIGNPLRFIENESPASRMMYPTVESTWLTQQPVNYFRRFEYGSGVNNGVAFRGTINAGVFPGITMEGCKKECLQRAQSLPPGFHIFIDSGAFQEWNRGGREKTVSSREWKKRYTEMLKLARVLGFRSTIVVPDKIADPDATTARQKMLAPLVQRIEATGAELLLPLQKGSKRPLPPGAALQLVEDAAINLGVPAYRLIPSIPMPANMWSDSEIIKLARRLPGDRIHLLGTSVKVSRPLIMRILEARPDMRISTDSVKAKTYVGYGPKAGRMQGQDKVEGAPGRTTRLRVQAAKYIDPEVVLLGYVGASDDLSDPAVRNHLFNAIKKVSPRSSPQNFLADKILKLIEAMRKAGYDVPAGLNQRKLRAEAGRFFEGAPMSSLKGLDWDYWIPRMVDESLSMGFLGPIMTQASIQRTLSGDISIPTPFNYGFIMKPDGSPFMSFEGPGGLLEVAGSALQERDTRLSPFGAQELIRYVLDHPVLTSHFVSQQAGASFDDFIDFMEDFSGEVHSNFMPWPFSSPNIENKQHPANDVSWRIQVQTS